MISFDILIQINRYFHVISITYRPDKKVHDMAFDMRYEFDSKSMIRIFEKKPLSAHLTGAKSMIRIFRRKKAPVRSFDRG